MSTQAAGFAGAGEHEDRTNREGAIAVAGLDDAEHQDREPDLSRLEFRFAKTMPETPHWYVVRNAANEADYVELFQRHSEKGVDEKFGTARYRYWYPGDGFKYWTMTTQVSRSQIINRAKFGAFYEARRER